MKTISNLQLVALIACAIMAVSCFLPWAEINSSSDILGVSASYSQKASGIKTGAGIIVLTIALIGAIITFLRPRLVTIAGILNLMIGLFYMIGLEKESYSISTGYGHANAGTGMGLYLLIVSSIVSTIIGFVILKRPEAKSVISAESENTTERQSSIPTIDIKPNLTPETKRALWKGMKYTFLIIGLVAVGILAFLIYAEFARVKQSAINNEKNRIDAIRASIQAAAASKDYNQAFTLINSFHWDLNPGDYPDYVKTYNEERTGLQNMVNQMKHEDDSIENRNRLIEQANDKQIQEQWNKDNALAHSAINFPFTAIVSSPKCFIYSEPNINSERKAELIQETDLNILSAQNEFYFCNFKTVDGKVESGWIYYNDITR